MQRPKDGIIDGEAGKARPPRTERSSAAGACRGRGAPPPRGATRVPAAKEVNGRDGPEPVRYGDWEVKGIASDF